MAAIAPVSAAPSMSAAVPYAIVSNPAAAAGKRRRETTAAIAIRAAAPKIAKLQPTAPAAALLAAPLIASSASPIVTVSQSRGAKRPQMKYDPSVPMTKEQTSAWRREQRRRRNRESAAACRRRQRDRIGELEAEVAGWREKVEGALKRLGEVDGEDARRELEEELETLFKLAPRKTGIDHEQQERCSTPPAVPQVVTSVTVPVQGSHVISPYGRPKFIPSLVASSSEEDIRFPILEDLKLKNFSGERRQASDSIAPRVENRQQQLRQQQQQRHLREKITRPAVKIAGAVVNVKNAVVNPPLPNIESMCDDLLQVVPDSCLSLTEKKTMPFPEPCLSLVTSAPQVQVIGPATDAADAAVMELMNHRDPTVSSSSGATVTTDESGEDSDLGEFLLDAVQWL